MPNGEYSKQWCDERHVRIDQKLNCLDNRIWAILLLLVGNLAGVAAILISGG